MKKPATKIRMSQLHQQTSYIARRAHDGERFRVSYNGIPWIEIGPAKKEDDEQESPDRSA